MNISNQDFKLVFPFIAIFILACNDTDKYSDFETDDSGLRYKYIEQSKKNDTIFTGDFVELDILYKNQNDSVLFNSKELRTPFRIQVAEVSHKGGSFENALLICHPGDKITFIVPADSFYNKTRQMGLPNGVEKGSDLLFEIKIIGKLSIEEIQKEREQYLIQQKEQEEILIKNYISDNQITIKPNSSGLYFIVKSQGTGKKANKGNVLTAHYIGKFLDGKVFDSSYQRNEPFEFQLGSQQVIEAWEEAFLNMKEGDKALLIVPSKLAYGSEGFGNLIPPYSPLIFEIELIAIN
jgi:FKBP-type peptidyl-prolyl cis-trans isomerase